MQGEDLVLPVIQLAAVAVGLMEYIILGQAMGAVQLAVMAVEWAVDQAVAVAVAVVTAAAAKVECLVVLDELVLGARAATPRPLGLFAVAVAVAATVAVELLG